MWLGCDVSWGGGVEVPGILGSMTWHRAAQLLGPWLQGPGDMGHTFSGRLARYLEQGRGETGQPFPINCSPSSPAVPCKEFAVTMRPTEASERCRLWGSYTLRTGESALELWGGPEPGTQLYEWPYRFLRRFGRDKVSRGCEGQV